MRGLRGKGPVLKVRYGIKRGALGAIPFRGS